MSRWLLLLLALVALPVSARRLPTWGTQGTGATYPPAPSIAIDSVTSDVDLNVTVASIPSGAVVVVLGSWDNDSATPPTCASSNLTFGAAKVHQSISGNASGSIFAAVAGSTLTNEVITVTQTGSPNRMTVVVLTGAASASFPTASGTNPSTTAMSGSINSTTAGSYVLGTWAFAPGGVTVSPGAGTTELFDNQPGWHVRSTSTSSGGTVTLTGTASGTANAAWALIEVLSQQGPP
jgi:hypothetical protein